MRTAEAFAGTGIHQLVRVSYHKSCFSGGSAFPSVGKNQHHMDGFFATIVHLVQLVAFVSSFQRGIPALDKRHVLGFAFLRKQTKGIFCSVVVIHVRNYCTDDNCCKGDGKRGSEQPNFLCHGIFLLTSCKKIFRRN